MAEKKTESPKAIAWRNFNRVARQYREAVGDDELRALLITRVRSAFDAWATAEEAGK